MTGGEDVRRMLQEAEQVSAAAQELSFAASVQLQLLGAVPADKEEQRQALEAALGAKGPKQPPGDSRLLPPWRK